VAQVEGGRVVQIEGSKDHPFTRGVLCAKVRDFEQRTYAPDRLLQPLRRVGPKGIGTFEPISWDDALDIVADRFSKIIAADGPEALLPFQFLGSMGVVQRQALLRLFHALGASQLGGGVCGVSGEALAAEGHPTGFDPEDMEHSDLIVLWGANILSTCHHHWHFIQKAQRRGTRVVSIDPRLTRTGVRCDQHIAIRPGTDAVLAAGLARIAVIEKLVDLDTARSVATDFDTFIERIEPWTLDEVSATCGIEENVIHRLAREIASARPALIRLGVGPQQSVHGDALVRGLSALSILGGHWRQPGGGLFIFTEPEFDDHQASCPELMSGEPRTLDMAALGSILTDRTLMPPINGLMIWTANPAVSQINAPWVRRGLARENLFTVVLEHFLTDTARFADIVLPSTTQLEHFDLQGAWGHHYISLNLPAIAPRGESKSNGEIMRALAKRMGLTMPALQESDEEIAAAALPPHVSLADLKKNGWQKASPLPWQPEALEAGLRIASDEILAPNPPRLETLQLLTPKSHYFMNSTFANMPRQRKDQGSPFLDMHPEDAAERGLRNHQSVSITCERARIKALLRLTDSILPGVVALEGKWWSHPEYSAAVSNLLSISTWSRAGQPGYNDTFVQVSAATPYP
jgi:anaerobic selenocysteine-containing dehydrogenase